MTHDDLAPSRFADAFLAFLDAVNHNATPPETSLADVIEEHLGVDPASLQVVTEQVDRSSIPTCRSR